MTGTASVINGERYHRCDRQCACGIGCDDGDRVLRVNIDAHAFALGIDQDVFAREQRASRWWSITARSTCRLSPLPMQARNTRLRMRVRPASTRTSSSSPRDDADTNVARAEVNNNGLIHVAATASAFNDSCRRKHRRRSARRQSRTRMVSIKTPMGPTAPRSSRCSTMRPARILSVEAHALASGVSADAGADAGGIAQDAIDGDVSNALASVQNDGIIDVLADAQRGCRSVDDRRQRLCFRCGAGYRPAGLEALTQAQALVNNAGALTVVAHAPQAVVANTFTFTATSGEEHADLYGHRQLPGWNRSSVSLCRRN